MSGFQVGNESNGGLLDSYLLFKDGTKEWNLKPYISTAQ